MKQVQDKCIFSDTKKNINSCDILDLLNRSPENDGVVLRPLPNSPPPAVGSMFKVKPYF